MAPHLSIVIPAYNEENAIRAGKLTQVAAWMKAQSYEVELIVVDDESQDRTAELAAETANQVVQIRHAGKAAAVIAGIRAAQGQRVLFSDMDLATPIQEAGHLMTVLQQGWDIASGSRGMVRRGAPPWRYFLSLGQVVLKTLLLGLSMTDTQCGFKAFTRSAALDVIEHLVVYAPERLGSVEGPSVTSGFDVEFLFVAQRLGYRIREVPVQWNYQHSRRVNLVRDAQRGMADLFNIVLARLARKYPRRRAAAKA